MQDQLPQEASLHLWEDLAYNQDLLPVELNSRRKAGCQQRLYAFIPRPLPPPLSLLAYCEIRTSAVGASLMAHNQLNWIESISRQSMIK